ncbi:unannotated protein [freshwater metagenome]|uniref:Unannotated protein n=1 Tax=freshwater metagenome TaxID=449393 RepID=A0A6J7CGU4_9ZZZZ
MADDPQVSSVARAIQQVTADTQALIRDEIALAKLELRQKTRTLTRATVIAAAAALFVIGALLLLLFGAAFLVADLISNEHIFWGFFVVAVLLLVLAGLAGLLAGKAFKKSKSPMPDQALAAARETRATFGRETTLMREQVRETIVHPEEERP